MNGKSLEARSEAAGNGAPLLELEGISRRFGEVTAVDALSLSLSKGEFVTLLGPSGCGKTTALRLIAGFEFPDAGAIRFDGSEVSRWTPQQRGFGMVFQNYALFPHLDVFENVAFGLRSRKRPAAEIRERVFRALERVDLVGYHERAVQALSGGQQQRVSLARALAIEPPLLLLDEPLSNLDQALRVKTRTELRHLVKELGITALFVTHDQEEAFDLSDRIAVMQGGRLRQIGTPEELYLEPVDRFVAGFVGEANLFTSELFRSLAAEGAEGGAAQGERARVMVRPEELRIVRAREGAADAQPGRGSGLPGVVRDRRFRGPITVYRVQLDGPDAPEVEIAGVAEGPPPGTSVRVVLAEGAHGRVLPESSTET